MTFFFELLLGASIYAPIDYDYWYIVWHTGGPSGSSQSINALPDSEAWGSTISRPLPDSEGLHTTSSLLTTAVLSIITIHANSFDIDDNNVKFLC